MREAKYLREQAKLALEIARQLSDPVAAAQVRRDAAALLAEAAAARVCLNAATFLAEAEEIEQQANGFHAANPVGWQKTLDAAE